MTVRLKPELEKFIEEQVRAGRFASAEEAVEAGIARLMLDSEPDDLNKEDLAAIEEGEAQIDRGDCQPWETVRDELRAKFLHK